MGKRQSSAKQFALETFAFVMSIALMFGSASGQDKQSSGESKTNHRDRSQAEVTKEQDQRDYLMQGEYVGDLNENAQGARLAFQVIAEGNGNFRAVMFYGGAPGENENVELVLEIESTKAEDGILVFSGERGTATISEGFATITDPNGNYLGKLERVVRQSPTIGLAPPENAVVLFDGSNADQWSKPNGKPAEMTDDGLLKQGAKSKQKFQDHRIHVEFLLPFQPHQRGQKRGNSGIYLQGRYEVQMLDSFGLSGENNECGGIYSIRKPDLNMCFPPMQWQTYDIEFHAAKFDGEKKTENAWMSVKHNGVQIHDQVPLPKRTTASPLKEGPNPGYVFLQDHNNEVRYRNIWVEELKD